MQSGAVSKMLGQISTQQIYDKGRGFSGGKKRYLRFFAHLEQGWGRRLTICHHQHRGFKRDDAPNAALGIDQGTVVEVANFTLAQHLQTVRVNVIQVPHQVGTRACHANGYFIKMPLRGTLPRYPLPFKLFSEVFK